MHKTTTNIATTNISTITPFTPRRQRSLHSRHDATFHNSATTIFTTRHSTSTVRSRSPRDGWKERSSSSSNQAAKGHLLPRTPAQNARANISRPKRPCKHCRVNLPPLVVVLSEKGEGWRVLSRLAGARCDASETGRGAGRREGGRTSLQKGVDEES